MIKENLEAQITVFLYIIYLGLLSVVLRLLVYCVTDITEMIFCRISNSQREFQ